MAQAAMKSKPATWKTALESRIPQKVYTGLESAFCKEFSLVFQQGRAVIEKNCRKEDIQADYAVQNFAVQVKGSRKELRKLHKQAKQADLINLAVTTVEGIGLGALGIGMPDIVLFLGTLLKGIYETALHYGFDYVSQQEQLLILKMVEVSLITGADWASKNSEVDEMISQKAAEATDEDFQSQIEATASAFAADMLLLKFVQGMPVVGILGGAANPVLQKGYELCASMKKFVYLGVPKPNGITQHGADSEHSTPLATFPRDAGCKIQHIDCKILFGNKM